MNQYRSPGVVIHKHCVECMGEQIYLVAGCTSPKCKLHPYRTGKKNKEEFADDKYTSLKAIRLMCLECVGFKREEVKHCTMVDCDLYPFRLGRNPNRAGIGGIPPNSPAFVDARNVTD